MSKSGMSAGFAKFAAKTTKGSYDEARKGERFGRGVPFPVGTKGTGLVGAIVCDETKANSEGEQFQRVTTEILIETPESHRGKPLRVGYFIMQDSKKEGSDWTAEDVWGKSVCGHLEDLGCPEELTKGYQDFQEVLDWFEAEPRSVYFEVVANNYKNRQGVMVDGKQVNCYAAVDESSIPSAEDSKEIDPDATYCTYKGGKHKVVTMTGTQYVLESVNGGNVRTVPKAAVQLIS